MIGTVTLYMSAHSAAIQDRSRLAGSRLIDCRRQNARAVSKAQSAGRSSLVGRVSAVDRHQRVQVAFQVVCPVIGDRHNSCHCLPSLWLLTGDAFPILVPRWEDVLLLGGCGLDCMQECLCQI